MAQIYRVALLVFGVGAILGAYQLGVTSGEKRVFEDCVDRRTRPPMGEPLPIPPRDAGARRDVWWAAPPREVPADVPPTEYVRSRTLILTGR